VTPAVGKERALNADGSSLRRDFADRSELIAYVRARFPEAADVSEHIAETRGGRRAALRRLEQVEPPRYAQTRNHLNGSVTHLSPYLRHGCLTLAEVRDAALNAASDPREAVTLIRELAWRDYFQRVYAEIGDGVWNDREPSHTGVGEEAYSDEVPEDVTQAGTGLACMDAFSSQLTETGYLHNHARLWMAAYLIHWRRVRWQAGARWFLSHLLDGDPASNNLSWQWVAGTFSQKPYVFNRENLEHFSGGEYCARCALSEDGCPFAATVEDLQGILFPDAPGDRFS
jgi:deoxyribodipyrimidine photo-lyase